MSEYVFPFEKLDVWQLAVDLAEFVYVKSTAQDRPWILVALEKIESKNEARWLERSLKKSRGKRSLCKNR